MTPSIRMQQLRAIVAIATSCFLSLNSAQAIILLGPQQGVSTATVALESRTSLCSATVVGPNVILTAASCLDGGDGASAKTQDGNIYKLSGCELIPEFKGNRALDIALCYSKNPIPLAPERIDITVTTPQIGDSVYLVGYGCTEAGGPGAIFGNLNVGAATVVGAPSINNWNITFLGSALCAGDAGSGIFASSGDGLSLIGVGSQSDQDTKSIASSVGNPIFVEWAKRWSVKHGAAICGFDAGSGCAQIAPTAQGSSQPASTPIKTFRTIRVAARTNDSISTVVIRTCGQEQPNSYYKVLEEYYSTYASKAGSTNAAEVGLDRNTIFGFGRDISIPVCANSASRLEKRIVGKDETAWSIFKAVMSKAKEGQASWQFRRQGKDSPGLASPYFVDVLLALNQGIKIERLVEGSNIAIPLSPLIDLGGKDPKGSRGTMPAVLPVSGPLPIFEVAPNNASCDNGVGGPSYPYDLRGLLDVLRTNRQGRTQSPAVKILVADSGVAGATTTGFFSDDILPGRMQPGIAPLFSSSSKEFHHGTEVASVVLGGPVFARVQGLGNPRIAVVVAPIYVTVRSSLQDQIRANDNWATQIQNRASNDSIPIVNLSLEVEQESQTSGIFSNKQVLFVVAAGNDFSSLYVKDVYPAKYGGEGGGKENVVTVAAIFQGLSSSGKPEVRIPDFSNRGQDYVDIAAPGCSVPAVAFQNNSWTEVAADGTSFSTPLVTFAAGLVKSEARLNALTALQIKRRLLVSADLHPELGHDIKDGRVLNLVKAVSLYQDVVEKKDGTVLFGSVQFIDSNGPLDPSDKITLDCQDSAPKVPVAVQNIQKIWPNYTLDGGAKFYWTDGGQQLMLNKLCKIPEALQVKVVDDAKREFGPFTMDEVRDVIPRLFR